MTDQRVTVVIVTRDRAEALDRTLGALTRLPERPPVIVVDNGSRDRTGAVVARHGPPVTLVRLPRNRGAAGRNHGVRLAATPYVAFSDDDSWWAPGALTEAADLLDRCPRVAVVAGRTVVGPQERVDPVSSLPAGGGFAMRPMWSCAISPRRPGTPPPGGVSGSGTRCGSRGFGGRGRARSGGPGAWLGPCRAIGARCSRSGTRCADCRGCSLSGGWCRRRSRRVCGCWRSRSGGRWRGVMSGEGHVG